MRRVPEGTFRPLASSGSMTDVDPATIYAISARSLVLPKTVARVLAGQPCKPVTARRVRAAAAELGIALPGPVAPEPLPQARGRRRLARP